MIKIKYKILNENENTLDILFVNKDNTYKALNLIKQNELSEVLKNAYILSRDSTEAYNGNLDDFEVYVKPTSRATFLKNVNFSNLSGEVYDQFGEKMNVDVEFTIDGVGARIEDGKIVEDAVTEDTSYFIVAKYGDLEERQERTIYAPREAGTSLEAEVAELRATIEEMLGGAE